MIFLSSIKKNAIVLAAGDGKRMKSAKPKVLCEVLFQPMLGWVLDALKSADTDKTAVIVGSGKEQVEAFLSKSGTFEIFTQEQRLGTGHAVMQAKEFLKSAVSDNAAVLVCCGDAPFISPDVIEGSFKAHVESGVDITVISAEVENPFGYGRIIKQDNEFIGITEQKDCTPEQAAVKEINSGIYWFNPAILLSLLDKLQNNNAAGEYYLTDTVALADKKQVYKSVDNAVVMGANNRAQLAALNGIARERVLQRLYDDGVDIPLTDGIIIGKDVKVGADTVILPGTVLKGNTVIGCGCEIGPDCGFENCTVGNNCKLFYLQAEEAVIDDNVTVGPYVHLRPDTRLQSGVKIGDFVEVKNSDIGYKTSISHLTYIGDSDVGKGVNFGCGCVTANYDGVSKFRTTIGDNAFIGCNTNLIAPVKIGDNATTGAGTSVTGEVPADSLAVERADLKIIEHWEKNSRRKVRYK